MRGAATALPRSPGTPHVTWVIAAAATAAVAVGLAVGTGRELLAAGLLAAGAAIALGLRSWRWSLYGLLVYIPVSGVPIIVTYPDTQLAVLLKDFLFVIPAYLGFLAWASTKRSAILFAGAPVIPIALLVLLVLGQTLNPSLPNLLVGAIGVKVWLLYVPLYFLGYHLIRDRSDLSRLLGVLSLSAVFPLVLGIVEALLIRGGQAGTVYGWYGDAAPAVSQNFAQFDYAGGGSLRRVSSTFSFVTQYFAFTTSMVVVTYAWWRGVLVGTKWEPLGRLLWLLALAAAFLSGARAAFLLIPLLVVLILVFDGRAGLVRLSSRMLLPAGALLAAFAALGVATSAAIGATLHTAAVHFDSVFVDGVRQTIGATWLGLGTGIDTNATRYAYSDLVHGVDRTWYESWWVKVMVELGVLGLILVCVLFAVLIGQGLRQHSALRDTRLRATSASLLALIVWSLAYGIKAQPLDFDPINVYFWLFAGVLARIAVLDRAERQTTQSLRQSVEMRDGPSSGVW